MKDLGNDDFSVDPGERIKIRTTVDKPPCIVAFQDPPIGGAWENIQPVPPCDQREFTSPQAKGMAFSFEVKCDQQIAEGDPDPVAHYTLTFKSISNPADPAVQKHINVPKGGTGPMGRFFTFTVV
ncbi:MAG: hypothetical protein WA672_12110 [Candidatus Angelobacter sp.]